MAVKEEHRDKITAAFADPEKITQALTKGVRDAQLAQTGRKSNCCMAQWESGLDRTERHIDRLKI